MKNKIAIIGAGPGGLTAAMILQSRGFEVEVYEKNGVVGGRNQQLKLGEYTFDTGPTFLMMNFVLKEMFEEAGEKLEDYLKLKRLEPMYHLDFGDIALNSYMNREKMKAEIARVFPGEEDAYDKFMLAESRRFARLFPCLQKDYTHWWSFFTKDFLLAIPYLGVGRNLFENLGRYFKDERLRLSFTFQSKYLGMAPWECPSGFTIIPFVEHAFGIDHVIGGLNKISLAMAEVVKKKGGKIFLNSPVKRVLVKNSQAYGVLLEDGREVLADDVVVNADFAYGVSHLFNREDIHKYTNKDLEHRQYSCSTFMIYLGVNKRYNLPHHNIYTAKDYRKNINEIFHSSEPSEDMSFYIQNASATDSTLAPEGKSTIYVLVPAANNFSGINWDAIKREYRNKVISAIKSRVPAMADLEEHIEVEKILTPLDWERDYNVYKGATFNLAHSLTQMLYLRPRNKFEEVENCYLVGGGTHPGSGLPTIYESARITSNLLCKKYKVAVKKPSKLHEKVMPEHA